MGSIADKLQMLLSTKGSIRDAIIAKGQSVADADAFASYAAKILAIQTGFDTSDATVAASDILSGKTAYGPEGKITGTMPEVAQATPSISVSSAGLITASATQGAGHVAAGTKSATQQLTAQSGTTITPGTSAKAAVASGRYTTGAVKVAGDANLTAGNIRSGVSIFGVAGSYNPSPAVFDVTFQHNGTSAIILYTNGNNQYTTAKIGSKFGVTSHHGTIMQGSVIAIMRACTPNGYYPTGIYNTYYVTNALSNTEQWFLGFVSSSGTVTIPT